MFDESKKNLDENELNKKHSYSFVLHHKDNRIISKIVENKMQIFLLVLYLTHPLQLMKFCSEHGSFIKIIYFTILNDSGMTI